MSFSRIPGKQAVHFVLSELTNPFLHSTQFSLPGFGAY